MRNKLALGALCMSGVLASGCTLVAPNYTPDYTALDSLKRQKLSKVAIESVKPRDLSAEVNKISLRGSSLVSSYGSFAQYLEQALISDFTDSNMLDPMSSVRLSTTLLKNDINVAGIVTGNGMIEAEFNVMRDSNVAFDKILSAEIQFDSSFMGSVAIPKGQTEYPNLVRALLKKLYTDKEFIQALKSSFLEKLP